MKHLYLFDIFQLTPMSRNFIIPVSTKRVIFSNSIIMFLIESVYLKNTNGMNLSIYLFYSSLKIRCTSKIEKLVQNSLHIFAIFIALFEGKYCFFECKNCTIFETSFKSCLQKALFSVASFKNPFTA